MSPRLRGAIGWSALVLWVGSNLLRAWPSLDYSPDPSIGIVMAIVAGGVGADAVVRKAVEMVQKNDGGPK